MGNKPVLTMPNLKVQKTGRLGNNILQFAHALLFARQIGSEVVDISTLGVFLFNPNFKQYVCSDGLVITRIQQPVNKNVIHDKFFNPHHNFGGLTFSPDISLIEQSFNDVSAVMGINKEKCGTSADICCHVRAGDIFLRPRPKANYVQPPLAFYVKAVQDLLKTEKYEKIRLIFETKDNPVVDGLISKENLFGVPIVPQSSELSKDITGILECRGIVMSIGTFTPMLCAISGKFEDACAFRESYFAQAYGPESKKTNLIEFFGTRVHHYVDDGSYIPVGGWEICCPDTEKSLEQKRMILDFPIEKINKVK
jgi:hypothetical protein